MTICMCNVILVICSILCYYSLSLQFIVTRLYFLHNLCKSILFAVAIFCHIPAHLQYSSFIQQVEMMCLWCNPSVSVQADALCSTFLIRIESLEILFFRQHIVVYSIYKHIEWAISLIFIIRVKYQAYYQNIYKVWESACLILQNYRRSYYYNSRQSRNKLFQKICYVS